MSHDIWCKHVTKIILRHGVSEGGYLKPRSTFSLHTISAAELCNIRQRGVWQLGILWHSGSGEKGYSTLSPYTSFWWGDCSKSTAFVPQNRLICQIKFYLFSQSGILQSHRDMPLSLWWFNDLNLIVRVWRAGEEKTLGPHTVLQCIRLVDMDKVCVTIPLKSVYFLTLSELVAFTHRVLP